MANSYTMDTTHAFYSSTWKDVLYSLEQTTAIQKYLESFNYVFKDENMLENGVKDWKSGNHCWLM